MVSIRRFFLISAPVFEKGLSRGRRIQKGRKEGGHGALNRDGGREKTEGVRQI